MINELFINTKEKMNKVISHYSSEISVIRTGRASTSMLDIIKVDYYGSMTPLNNISNISSPSPESIIIQPFDPSSLESIEKAILSSNLGMNPNNDGNIIRLNVPPLTEERRRDLVKQAKSEIELAKVSVRNIRQKANDEMKKLGKEGLSEDLVRDAEGLVQDLTNTYASKIDTIYSEKESDIMTV